MRTTAERACGSGWWLHAIRAIAIVMLCASTASAATYLVSPGGSDTPPYDTWAKAATDIQTAVDAASPGETVLVTNGTYNVTAEVVVTNAITLRSVNGPDVTIVDAGGVAGRRVLFFSNTTAVVSGFTLKRGNRPTVQQGGNVWMSGGMLTNCVVREGYLYGGIATGAGIYLDGGTVTHCTIADNNNAGDSQGGRYTWGGGGVYMAGGLLENSTLSGNACNGGHQYTGGAAGGGVKAAGGLVRNCLIRDNAVTGTFFPYGGGAGVGGSGVLLNCTIVGNTCSSSAGGVSSSSYTGGSVSNCIIYGNTSTGPGEVADIDEPAIARNSCSPDLTEGVNGNITREPLFVDPDGDDYRLSLASPCRNAGTNVTAAGSVDLDDGDRVYTGDGAGVIDMGAYEVGGTGIPALVCDFAAEPAVGRAPLQVVLTAAVLGPNTNGLYYWWDFDNSGGTDAEGSDKRLVTNEYATGRYSVRLTVSNELGQVTNRIRAAYVVSVPSTIYASAGGSHVSPFASWAEAATNLADALALQVDGGTVLVTNGTYALSAEWPMDKGVAVRSVNGPDDTTVQRVGASPYRLFVLTHADAALDGLTVQNGYRPSSGYGANVWMSAGVLTNCIVRNGATYRYGGSGVYMSGGLVTHCVISNNVGTADQDGRYSIGGGGVLIDGGILENSLIAYNANNGAGNTTPLGGGGIRSRGGLVRNCLVRDNSTTGSRGYGGGVGVSGSGVILNCTVTANDADTSAGGVSSVRIAGGYATNCIVYGNTCGAAGAPVDLDEPGIAAFSCSSDLTNGVNGNSSDDPLFIDEPGGNFELALASPCRNAGTNVSTIGAVDLNDTARIFAGDGEGIVDMGAYEVAVSGGIEADFSGTPVAGLVPLEVVFTANVLGATNGLFYWWDFDNDGNAELSGAGLGVVTNVFSSPGVYAVNMIVSNAAADVTNKLRSDYITCAPVTVYVAHGGSSTVPYDTWANAATSVADAVAFQQPGGSIAVSNGTYGIAAELVLDKAITVRGWQGAQQTVLRRDGASDYRPFSLTHSGAVLADLTIENGRRPLSGYGANVWMNAGLVSNCIVRSGETYRFGGAGLYMAGGLATHCTITNNVGTADQDGRYSVGGGGVLVDGGILQNSLIAYNTSNGGGDTTPLAGGGVRSRGGLVRNCLVRDNTATGIRGYGGGVGVSGSGVILNCTVAANDADASAGGVSSVRIAGGYVTNCIVYGNTCGGAGAPVDIDEPGIAAFACSPDLTNGVNGNLTADPKFVGAPDYSLQLASPCRNAGTNLADVGTLDLADNPRVAEDVVDMGAYEGQGGAGQPLQCDFTATPESGLTPLSLTFTAAVGGDTNGLHAWWDFDANGNADTNGAGLTSVGHTYTQPGLYSVRLTVSNALAEVTNRLRADYIIAAPPTVLVSPSGSHTAPYDTWAKAATNVAAALAFQQAGGTVLVGDGTYPVTAEITLDRAIVLRGYHGASETVLQRVGASSFRLFSLTHAGAVLDGLTIENGYRPLSGYGANVWMSAGLVTNCVVRNGETYRHGGAGIYLNGGTVARCVISNNVGTADQDGRYSIGGGGVLIDGGLLDSSLVAWNRNNGGGDTTPLAGGGVRSRGGVVRNCLIRNNRTTGPRGYGGGGGVSGSGVILNCTVTTNSADTSAGGISSVRIAGGYVTNCIVYGNTCAAGGAPDDVDEPSIAAYSCASDLAEGFNGNTTSDPLFVDAPGGDCRLLAGSPCIDAGLDMPWVAGGTDLDGLRRRTGTAVDMGAYEYHPPAGTLFVLR